MRGAYLPIPVAHLPMRFWFKVEPLANDCWQWIGGFNNSGYGMFHMSGSRSKRIVHRLAYQFLVGPIPAGLEIDHLCRNRACINPLHLEAVSRRENIRRSYNFIGRQVRQTHCKRGHPFTGDNLWIREYDQGRICLACRKLLQRRKYLRNKLRATA